MDHYDRTMSQKSPKWIFTKKKTKRAQPRKQKTYGKRKLLSKMDHYDRTEVEKSPEWIFTKKKDKTGTAPETKNMQKMKITIENGTIQPK